MMTELHPVEREQVMAFLDGELEPKLAARVAAHIDQCAECRNLRDDLRGVSSHLLAWSIEPAPANLTQAINFAVPADPSKALPGQLKLRPSVPLWRRIVFSRIIWATACLLVCVGIVLSLLAPLRPARSVAQEALTEQRIESDGQVVNHLPAPPPGPPIPASRRQPGGGGRSESRDLNGALDEITQDMSAGPMIARTASLKISVKDVDAARASVDKIIQQFRGYAASLAIHSEVGVPRSIESEVHVPALQSDAVLAAFKSLGRVEQEEQGGEEVTAQVIDLDARLKNAHETETRLQDILRTRTGKVSEVLEVEKVMADTRENIERMEAEQKELRGRVAYASIKLELHEEYQATLGAGTSVGRQLRNAIVDGFQAAGSGALAVFLWLLNIAPSLLLAALILFLPVRWAWRRYGKGWKDWMERGRSAQA